MCLTVQYITKQTITPPQFSWEVAAKKINNNYLFHLLDGPLCPVYISAKINPIHLEKYKMLDKGKDLIKCQI